VVGSSIVKNAFIRARAILGGLNLGLARVDISIWWQGRGGMVINQVENCICKMLCFEN